MNPSSPAPPANPVLGDTDTATGGTDEHGEVGGWGLRPEPSCLLGDRLFDPRHGVVVVEANETRTRDGRTIDYLALRSVADRMRILVPRVSVTEIGIRSLMTAPEAAAVLMELATTPRIVPEWTPHSFADYSRRAGCTNPFVVARVLRDLVAKAAGGRLRPTEHALRQRATESLAAELLEALSVDHNEALSRIDHALAAGRAGP